MHSLLDHVHQLYPVELTEFVDDITHKVEGTGATVLRVLPQSVEYVAKEMRALGLTVSLKSGMVASSQDFGKALLNTLAKSDVRMGLHDHIRDLGLDALHWKEAAQTHCTSTTTHGGAQSRKGLIHAHAQGSRAAAFPWRGIPAVDVRSSAVWALSDGGCELFEGKRHGRAPRWAMADVSRRCSLWRWG